MWLKINYKRRSLKAKRRKLRRMKNRLRTYPDS